MTGGVVGGELLVDGDGSVEFEGGEVNVFVAAGNASALISGGSIGDALEVSENSQVNILDVDISDDVDAFHNALLNLQGGTFGEDVTASDMAALHITGGSFPAIFSDGAELTASQGTVSVTGGMFGEPGVSDGGRGVATLGGHLVFQGAEIAGANDGTAPIAEFSSVLNGLVEISEVRFGELLLEAANSGTINLQDVVADSIQISALAGGVTNILGGHAASVTAMAEIGGAVNLQGGSFEEFSVTLLSESILTITGHSFTFNGTPIDELDAVLGDPDAFIEETGELRVVAGDLAGILADGSTFGLQFSREFTPLPGARVFLVPEPAGWSLMVWMLGLAACRIVRSSGFTCSRREL
jgi:hypothetical protein